MSTSISSTIGSISFRLFEPVAPTRAVAEDAVMDDVEVSVFSTYLEQSSSVMSISLYAVKKVFTLSSVFEAKDVSNKLPIRVLQLSIYSTTPFLKPFQYRSSRSLLPSESQVGSSLVRPVSCPPLATCSRIPVDIPDESR